jgi:enhancing lycopene biosynthesis protein 2
MPRIGIILSGCGLYDGSENQNRDNTGLYMPEPGIKEVAVGIEKFVTNVLEMLA